MKPAQRRYSERDSPDWSPRTMSALGARGRLLHIWSPWYPVTSTRRARCASAPRKYTSSPLASAARNGSSGPAGASGPRQASRARRRSRTPRAWAIAPPLSGAPLRSEEHTSELQSRLHLVCRLLLEKKKKDRYQQPAL